MRRKLYKGAIALPTAVLIGSVLLLGGLSVVLNSVDVKRATAGYNEFTGARLEAKACQEEAMMKLKWNPTYTGNFNLTFPDGVCDVVVSDIGPATLKEVVVTSSNIDSDYEMKYEVDVSDYPLTVTRL